MKLAIIAAIGKNRVIGKGGKLPWHISDDLKRFKRLTTGHTVLMGRRTWESLGRSLSNRRNVVITSTPIPGAETYPTIDAALTALAAQEKVFVIGGAQIYAAVLDRADELYLTFVDQIVEGDAYFPPYEALLSSRFKEVLREKHPGFEFADYVRVG
jgi:dihydrofolate reductase